jgi:CheY-like chemotaxis protein
MIHLRKRRGPSRGRTTVICVDLISPIWYKSPVISSRVFLVSISFCWGPVMGVGSKPVGTKLPATPWGYLPPQMRVLFITGSDRTGGWLAEAFASDSASEVLLVEAMGVASGLARLRDELFDAVLISHDGRSVDALEVLDAIRAGSSDEQPIVVLGQQSERRMADLCFESGADAYLCVEDATTRTLIWQVARATERYRLINENRRLEQDDRHRLRLEEGEAKRLLEQQWSLIDGHCGDARSAGFGRDENVPNAKGDLPESLIEHYRELLRAYVVMGAGNLRDEVADLADLFVSVGTTSRDAMRLHLYVLEEMIDGLGSRSARHVMNRADLLVVEMMVNLAEGYRELRHPDHAPARQQMLPGFEPAA